jgi:anthranilate phosphoribosyltransferase
MDIALLNAAAVTYVAGKAPGIAEGLQLARDSVRSGRAQRKLQDLIEFGRR